MGRYRKGNLFYSILELSKVRITFAVALTTATGYILAGGNPDTDLLLTTVGIFFLACGASVINHLQESQTDLKMNRTFQRPIPSGKISKSSAWIIALVHVIIASALLFPGSGIEGLTLGWLALVWYNLIYTYLKKITAHAVIPGSVIGAIPPLVGWVAAGQDLADLRVLGLGLFFFSWQVPHFYLLVLKYGKEYEQAGLPSLTMTYSTQAIKKLVFGWIIVTAVSVFLLRITGVTKTIGSVVCFSLTSLWLLIVFGKQFFSKQGYQDPGKYFMRINYYVLIVIVILLFDNLIVRFF